MKKLATIVLNDREVTTVDGEGISNYAAYCHAIVRLWRRTAMTMAEIEEQIEFVYLDFC